MTVFVRSLMIVGAEKILERALLFLCILRMVGALCDANEN